MTGPPLVSSGSAGPMGKRGDWPASAAPPAWEVAGGPATWASVWNRGSEWRPTPARLSGFISRPWRWGACRRCAIWASAMSRGSAPLQTRKRRWSCSGKRRSTAPPGGRGCWPAVWNRGWDCPRTKRLPWNGCGPPPFRGTPPARRSWPGTMSLASGRRSPPSRPYSGTAVRLRQGMRTDSAVWAG